MMFSTPLVYQLDFVTPGSLPSSARTRKQIRQMPNFRMYPRGRPQIRHRLYLRTPNFGGRAALAINDFFATFFSSVPGTGRAYLRNGIPNLRRSSRLSSTVRAFLITNVTFIPRTRLTLSTFTSGKIACSRMPNV